MEIGNQFNASTGEEINMFTNATNGTPTVYEIWLTDKRTDTVVLAARGNSHEALDASIVTELTTRDRSKLDDCPAFWLELEVIDGSPRGTEDYDQVYLRKVHTIKDVVATFKKATAAIDIEEANRSAGRSS